MQNVSVADMNQSLVDDGLVDKEKIGGSNYFWSFPAKKDRLMQIQYQKSLSEIDKLKVVLAEANSRLIDAKRGREDDDDGDETDLHATNDTSKDEATRENANNEPLENEITAEDADKNGSSMPKKRKLEKSMTRSEKLRRLEEIAKEKAKIESEMETLKENDPQVLADLEKEFKFVQEAANRWTDNIFNCKSYLVKKRNIDKKEANRILGIKDDFDCTYCFHDLQYKF